MDARQFLAEFEHIASAPGGIQRIRELVIHLAVSGRLIQSVQEPQVNSRNEYPYQIPDHWSWQRLDEISTYIQRGKGPTYASQGSTLIVSQKCVQWRGLDLSVARHADEASIADYGEERFLQLGDVLLNSTGTGTVGRVATYKTETAARAVADSHVTVIRLRNVLPEYLRYVLTSPDVQVRMSPEHPDSLVSGTTKQVELALGFVKSLVVPIPPTEQEQQRIVAKVDELMALCDRLETQQQRREALGRRIRRALSLAILSSNSPDELKVVWSIYNENSGVFESSAYSVDALRIMVRESTVKGWFASDEAGLDQLLSDIRSKKLRGNSERQTPVSLPPFGLPRGWRWVLLDDLLHGSEAGWSPKSDSSPREGNEWGVLKVSAVTWGVFQPDENKQLPIGVTPKADLEVKPGDFLLSRANTVELVARSVVTPKNCPMHLMLSDKIVRLDFVDDRLKPWVNLVNNSDYARTYYAARASGTSESMRNVSRQTIHDLPIPLAPLALQDKLISTYERLELLLQDLEAQLNQSSTISEQLAKITIATITGIRTDGKQPDKMKAPKTELVSTLRLAVGNGQDAADRAPQAAPLAALLARNDGVLPAKTLYAALGLEIDAFYQQLKIEMARGWIVQPEPAYMRERDAEAG